MREFSVDHGPQHNKKNGTIIYNLLSLNDDKRLNIVPAKSSTWKRVNIKHIIPDPYTLGWGRQQEGIHFITLIQGSTSTADLKPRRLAQEQERKMDPLEKQVKEGKSRRKKSHSVIHHMGTAAKHTNLGLSGKAKYKFLSAAFYSCSAVKVPKAQDAVEDLPIPWKHEAESKTRAPDR